MRLAFSRTHFFLFLFCILPQVVSVATQKEMFPWSPFPMYAGLDTGKDLTLVSAYVVDDSGKLIPIERAINLRPKYEYRQRLPVDKIWHEGITEDQRKVLRRFAEIFRDDLRSPPQAKHYQKIIFFLEYWQHFSGLKRYQPDERRTLLEFPLD